MIVKVYFNLRKKCFSIQHKGKVIAHADTVKLKNVTYKVSEAGRQRVLKERHKNVHAFLVGEWVHSLSEDFAGIPVTYNPYKYSSFVDAVYEFAITNSKEALLEVVDMKGKIYAS